MDADSPVDMTTAIIRHHVLIVVGGRPVDPYIHILLPSALLWLISNLSRFGKPFLKASLQLQTTTHCVIHLCQQLHHMYRAKHIAIEAFILFARPETAAYSDHVCIMAWLSISIAPSLDPPFLSLPLLQLLSHHYPFLPHQTSSMHMVKFIIPMATRHVFP